MPRTPPVPLWGGGGGRASLYSCAHGTTPTPSLPHKGGRESTRLNLTQMRSPLQRAMLEACARPSNVVTLVDTPLWSSGGSTLRNAFRPWRRFW